MKPKHYILTFSLIIFALTANAAKINDVTFTVALDGSGNFTKIQDAIDAVKPNQKSRTIIRIKNGVYQTEKLIVPEDKQNITFLGENRDKTIISYHIYDCKDGLNNKCPAEDAAKWTGLNIRTSATIAVYGNGFRAENITFRNTAGPVGQALAITVCADKNTFVNCSFLGYQDTIYLWTAGSRSYFLNCLIVGRTDFIYGAGIAFFDDCEIKSFGGGWITAPSTPKDQPFGFIFYKCKITFATDSPRKDDDHQSIALGRPWHAYPKVAWLYCDMCKNINPQGWNTTWRMDYADTDPDLHLYEYKNSGAGADMTNRSKWAGLRALNDEEAKQYNIKNILSGKDNWNPLKIK